MEIGLVDAIILIILLLATIGLIYSVGQLRALIRRARQKSTIGIKFNLQAGKSEPLETPKLRRGKGKITKE